MSNLILGNLRTKVVCYFNTLKDSEVKTMLNEGISLSKLKETYSCKESLYVSFDTLPFKAKLLKKPPDPISGNITLDYALTDVKTPGLVKTQNFFYPTALVGNVRLQITTVALYENDKSEYVECLSIPCSVQDDVPGKGIPD